LEDLVRLALVALALLACSPPPPAPGGDVDDCGAACQRIHELGCAASWGLEDNDGDCLTFCQSIETGGDLSICPALVARAQSCDEIDQVSQCEASP
jgi:hypothetical protein